MRFGVVTLFYQKWSLFYLKTNKSGDSLLLVNYHRFFHLRGGVLSQPLFIHLQKKSTHPLS